MNSPWDVSLDNIMKQIHDMADDFTVRNLIREKLELAYRRGYADADRNPRQPESMGR